MEADVNPAIDLIHMEKQHLEDDENEESQGDATSEIVSKTNKAGTEHSNTIFIDEHCGT